MLDFNLITAFMIGLAGGVHCIGMCGSIAGAFTFAVPKDVSLTPYVLCYNVGRISSYTIAGMITGFLGSIFSSSLVIGITVLQAFSIVFLLLLALYISDVYKGLIVLEKAGGIIWKKIAPYGKKLIPFKSPYHTILYGVIWGWLPCGLVYSALTWSLASGNTVQGGLFMLFFGLGTLPTLIASSFGASFLLPLFQSIKTRRIIAFSIICYAIFLTFQLFQSIK